MVWALRMVVATLGAAARAEAGLEAGLEAAAWVAWVEAVLPLCSLTPRVSWGQYRPRSSLSLRC